MSGPLLQVDHLVKSYGASRSIFRAAKQRRRVVDDVSFHLEAGETLAIVGESGAGKSTTARLVLRLVEPDSGSVWFDGIDVLALARERMRRLRRRMQLIFQDPHGSLNPRLTIGDSVGEPLLVHDGTPADERHDRAVEMLAKVGLRSDFMRRYPSELSGGQLQRVAIARALTLEPDLIVCDEPVAALDMSVRAQVLNLLHDLQDELGIAYLFISHDLALVEVIADRVAVMRGGILVEQGPTAELFSDPVTAYTKELLAAIPRPVPGRRRRP